MTLSKKVLEWHDRDGRGEIDWIQEFDADLQMPVRRLVNPQDKHPRELMADLKTLYDRSKGVKWMAEFGGNPLVPCFEEDDAVARLISLRNDFVHFLPQSWSVEITGLPIIVGRCLNLIEKLLDHPANQLKFDSEERQEVIEYARKARQQLEKFRP
jgi:hypothetical protein